jgi:hypothetical protein
LIHKFSGVSRRSMLRIFGRTTLVSQFMSCSGSRFAKRSPLDIWRPGSGPASRP